MTTTPTTYKYPSDDEIQELYDMLGTKAAVARELGIPINTFIQYCNSNGILKKDMKNANHRGTHYRYPKDGPVKRND